MSFIYEFEIDDDLIPGYCAICMRNTEKRIPLRFDDYVRGYEAICQAPHVPLTPRHSLTSSAIQFATVGQAIRLAMIEDVWAKPIKFLWPHNSDVGSSDD